MVSLTTELLARACGIFMQLAYPGGIETVPSKKRFYWSLPVDRPVSEFLPPAPAAGGVCQGISAEHGGVRGYAFRLGSAHYPNLKLKVQLIDFDSESTWVVMVDTHDGFSRGQHRPPDDHPDAPEWMRIQDLNRRAKEEIESAWDKAGLTTFSGLLRRDLGKRGS